MVSFGLISEGPSDQIVIENILFGFFKNPDLVINRLQPKPQESGNWVKVLDYCRSNEFKSALTFNEYLIVQIDTDVLISEQLPPQYKIDLPTDLDVVEIVERVSQKLISLIDDTNNFWNNYGDKIIFAISVHAIECWLLPIYYKNQPQTSSKTTGCLKALNKVLSTQEGYTIDAKEERYYTKPSKKLRKEIHNIYTYNPSLRIFVENIQAKNIVIEDNEV